MRILVAHNRYTAPGGEDTVFEAEMALLESRGHTVIAFEDSNKRIASMNPAAAATRAVWSRETKKKLQSILSTERPDIAHFHNTFALISPSAYYACADAGIPVVQTLHNYRLLCPSCYLLRKGSICEKCVTKGFKWPAIVHACYQQSRLRSANIAVMLTTHRLLKTWQNTVSAYIALSQFAKEKFVEGGLPAGKIFVKPNFFSSESTQHTSDKSDYLVFIGRLSEEKGLHLLMEAMTHARHVPIRIIGDGPMAAIIDERIRQEGLHRVVRLGQLPHAEVLRQLGSAACLVLPSITYEGFPMTIVEAFAQAKPVITSQLGSMAEIVDDGVTGLHFASGNAAELADRIIWAWTHKDALREMGRNAHREYTQQYKASRNYEMLTAIYRQVLDRS